jgi:hypothetical protein
MRVRSWGLVRKKMRAGKAGIGEHAERERNHTDFKSTSSPVVASSAAAANPETSGYKLLGVVKFAYYLLVCLSMSRKISEFQTDLRSGTVSKDAAIPVLLHQQRQTSFLTSTETDFWGKVASDDCF